MRQTNIFYRLDMCVRHILAKCIEYPAGECQCVEYVEVHTKLFRLLHKIQIRVGNYMPLLWQSHQKIQFGKVNAAQVCF